MIAKTRKRISLGPFPKTIQGGGIRKGLRALELIQRLESVCDVRWKKNQEAAGELPTPREMAVIDTAHRWAPIRRGA